MIKKFIDVCSGLGGFRLALEAEGHKCVGFSEVDKYAIKVYKDNFDCSDELEIGDITTFDGSLPEHDIICAGFPCQPFSMAGKRKGLLDDRGKIFYSILDLAIRNNTKTLILENVRGLLSINKGKTFRGMVEDLERSGYKVSYKVICGSNVTIQNRKRLFIVADREDKFSFEGLKFNKRHHKLSEILEPLTYENSLKLNSLTISCKLFSCLEKHKNKHSHRKNGFGYSVFYPISESVRTISSRYYKDGSECLIYDLFGGLPRKLSVDEMKRLFTFPNSYKLNVSRSRAYMLLGNSVIVDIVRSICQNLK